MPLTTNYDLVSFDAAQAIMYLRVRVLDGVTVDATLAVFVFKYVSVAGFTPPTGASTLVCGIGVVICIPGPDAMDVESWNVEEAASTFT